MASCCPGVTECKHLITIGFLQVFIGSDLQDENGNTMSVSHPNGTAYCPTYSELTGGTLIHNWKQGTTPNGDRDGIIIGGSYASNECVRREDLSMKYTRFKSLGLTASPSSIDACSGCSTLSVSHLYNRYTKVLDDDCESAESPSVSSTTDTASGEVTYTSSNNVFTISGNTVCVGKNNPNNNGRSNSRSTTITAKITFRGSNKTATATITQAGLTGEYKYWYHTYEVHGKDVDCGTQEFFGCEGGNYSATAFYYQDDWDVYRWQDRCGTNYDSDTEQRNRVDDQYKVYETYSGSFDDKNGQCGTWTASTSWDGYGSCEWVQSCTTCTCDDYIEWGTGTFNGTVPCTGGTVAVSASVPYTAHTRYIDSETKECVDVPTATSTTLSDSVTIGCNSTTSTKTHTGIINHISYTITQTGNCCTPSRTYNYNTITLSCQAHENENVRTEYTATTIDNCCNRTYSYGWTDYYKVNIGCNSGSTRTLTAEQKSNAPFTIIQSGDIACCGCFDPQTTYTIADIEIGCDEAPRSSTSVSYTAVTTYSNCASETVTSTTTVEIPPVECNSGGPNVIQQGNTGATLSEAKPKITQNGGCVCTCVNPQTTVTFADVELQCSSAASSTTSVVYTAVTRYDNCGPETIVSAATVGIPAVECNSGSVKTIQAGNTGTTVETAKPKITQLGGCPCTSCTCGDLTISSIAESWNSNVTTPKQISVSSSCATDISINSVLHFNTSLSNNKITVSPKGNNTTISAYTDTLTVSYKASNNPCSSSITLTQYGITPCEPSERYVYEPIVLPCSAATRHQLNVNYTKVTKNIDCTETSATSISAVTVPAVECNSGGTRNIQGGLLKITQAGGCNCVEYTCNSFDVVIDDDCPYGKEKAFPSDAFSEFNLLKIVPKNGQNFFNDNNVKDTVTLKMGGNTASTAYTSCRLDTTGSGDNTIGIVKVTLGQTHGETGLTSTFILCIGTLECEVWNFTRICPGVTDNCVFDAINSKGAVVKVTEPIYMHAWNEGLVEECFKSDGITPDYCPSRNIDSLLISQVGGSHISAKTSSTASVATLMTSEYDWDESDDGNFTGYTGSTWWKGTYGAIDSDTGKPWLTIYIGNDNSSLMYSARPNHTNDTRKTSYVIISDGNQKITSSSIADDHPSWVGQNACIETTVEVWQAPEGYKWIHYEPKRFDENGAEIRGLAPIYDQYSCVPTYFAFESNIQAESGDDVYIGYCELDGTCPTPTELDHLSGDYVIDKNVRMVKVSENGYSIYGKVNANTSPYGRNGTYRLSYGRVTSLEATITQVGSGIFPCSGILNMSYSIPSEGISDNVVGTYSLNGTCNNIDIRFVNGSGDNFLTSLRLVNGVVYGTCQPTNYEKYGSYELYVVGGDTISQPSEARQLEPSPTYTYTVIDNGNAEGAVVALYDGETPIASGTISSGMYYYQTSTYYAALTVVVTKTGCDTVETTVNANNTSSVVMSCETPVDPCVNEGAPDIEPYSIQHQYNTSEYYTSSFESSCWRIYSASSNDPSLAEVASYNDTSVTILCNANELGSSTEVYVYVVRTDGVTARLQIDLYWQSMQSCSGTLYLDSPWAADSDFEDEVIGYYTVDGDCGNITISYIDGDSILLNPTLLANGDVQGGVLENMQGKRQGRYGLFNSGQLLATAVVEQLPSCAAIGYDASGIQLDYIDVYFDSPLTISYPDTSNCWSPTIIYTEGDNLVSDEIYTSNSVTLTFNDTGDVKCYIQFVNTKTGITVRSGDITIQLVQ